MTGWTARNTQIADINAQKEYDEKWFNELDVKVNKVTDIDQLRGIALQLGILAKRTNRGYVELKDQYQASLNALPEILAIFTFLVGLAW